MIAPTLRAIWLMLLGLPIMLAIAVLAPNLWVISAGWIAGLFGLMLADLALAGRRRGIDVKVVPPAVLYTNSEDPVEITVSAKFGPLPSQINALLETNEYLAPPNATILKGWYDRTHTYAQMLEPTRRGNGRLETLWLNWTGPLGLIRIRRNETLDLDIPITPNTRWVKEEAVRLYTRDADFGIKMQIERGDGSEFDALREFSSGMDRRAIDWKHSARHRSLLAKEFRTERNHNIVFAFDSGRLMCEPLGGVPKIDRAINAALLLAYVSLRSGDKTALFGFDARPTVTSNVLAGVGAFPHMQRLASQIDYSVEEANYTLAITSLAARLERRSLIILFTDFVDTISAERITTVEQIMRNNLEPELYEKYRDVVTSATMIEFIEDFSKSMRPAQLPIDGYVEPGGVEWADIEAEMFRKDDNGNLLRSVDMNHERKIQRMMKEFGGDKPYTQTFG